MNTQWDLLRSWLKPTAEVFTSTSIVTKIVASVGAFMFASILKSLTPAVIGTIFLLVLIDTIAGLAVAIKKKKVSSKRWFRCLIKLFNYSGLIIVGGITSDISLLSWLSSTFLLLIVVTEILSILENISIIQPDLVPSNLIKVLHLLKD